MMPLEKKTDSPEVGKQEKVSSALSTEEIVSLLSKSNKDFIKESDISPNIKNLFKRVTPAILAEKKKDLQKNNDQQIDEKVIETSNQEISEKSEGLPEEKKAPEKIYTEEDAKRLANDYAKKYYNNGYTLGVKKTTEELQRGDKALAATFKRATDAIFQITPKFLEELNDSTTNLINKLCKEVIGVEIDTKSNQFQEKITKLVQSIEGSIKNVEVFLNPKDFSAITDYNTKNKINLSFKVSSDESLQRGDLKIKSNGIEINEFVTDKLKFSSPESIDSDLQRIKDTEQNNNDT